MKLRARWTGSPPRVGDYLMSEVRPRHAYRVLAVRVTDCAVRWDAERKAEIRRLQIDVDRVATSSVPEAARVHPWRWDRRTPRSKVA